MGKTFNNLLAADLLAFGLLSAAVPALAEDVTAMRVVVHVVDYASVPRIRMVGVQKLVTSVFKGIDVPLTFVSGGVPGVSEPGVLDLQVAFLSAEMVEEKCRKEGLSDRNYGSAVRMARRAYVFYDRALALEAPDSSPAMAVAAVLAHELGHLLLPEYSHSPDGLMRPRWRGPIRAIPSFNRVQVNQIHERLRPWREMAAR